MQETSHDQSVVIFWHMICIIQRVTVRMLGVYNGLSEKLLAESPSS